MEELPDEVMMMIFELLPSRELLGSAAHVCRRWGALLAEHAVAVERFDDLERVHRRTRCLRIATRIIPFQSFLLLTPTVAPYLRDLTIYAVNPFSVEHFQALDNLPHLQHLDIFLRDRILDTELVPVMLKMKSFVINEIVSARVLRALAESKRLHSLYMYGRSLYYPRRELLALLRARRFHLKELTLRCTELHDASYAAIGLCEGLTSLQLYSCWLMTGIGALHTTKPKKIRRLHVTGARMVRTRSLATFVDRIPQHVEELNLSMTWFGDEHVATLIHRLPRLRVLELWKCRITPRGVLKLAENLEHLTFLDLDIILTNEQVLELDRHPSLLFLRCLTEYYVRNNPYMPLTEESTRNVQEVVTKKIKVIGTCARYPFKYFRPCSEGYRAALFYYWMQDVHLQPLPNGAVPAFDEEDEFY